MKILRTVLLFTTALVAMPDTAEAAPVALAVFGTIAGSVASAFVAGSAIVWSSILGQAAVAGVLSAVQMALSPKSKSSGSEITLNRIQPITSGLIVYGERTLGGTIIARSTTAVGNKPHKRYHSIMPLACHQIDGVVEAFIGETKVWTETQYLADQTAGIGDPLRWGQIASDFKNKFIMKFYLGTASQAAEPRYVAAASEWAASAQGKGIAYVYFEADYDQNVFPQGADSIRVRIRGKKVYDPRDGQTRYSANPFLCLRDYVLTPELFGGVGWSAADIDDAIIIAHANIADETIALVGGATEKRYAYNGVLDTSDAPEANLNRLSTSWGGWWSVDRSKLIVGGAAWEPATFTVTEDMLAGPAKVRARRPFEQQFNIVKAVYSDPSSEHTLTDLPVMRSATYVAQDNGEELVNDLGELPGETSWTRGQRLMKLAMLKGRRQRTVELPCTLEAWDVALGDNIMVTIPRRGWAAKTFEVVGRSVSIQPGQVRVNLSVIESGPAVFDWTTSEETARPAGGVPSLISPTARPIIGTPYLTEENYSTRTGGVKTAVTVSASTDNPFISRWEFSLRPAAEAVADVVSAFSEAVTFDDVAPGFYVLGARAQNHRGIWSDWVYSGAVEVYGLAAPPVALTGLSAAVNSGLITLRWNQSPDLDVRQGGEIEIRHSFADGATWQTSTTYGYAVPGSSTLVTGPALSGTFLIAARDSQGIRGPATAIPTNAPDVVPFNLLATVTEHAAFTGAKTNCALAGAELVLNVGQVAASYAFAGAITFAAVKTVRLTARVAAIISERSALFDSAELFDSTARFDGSEEAEGDVTIWVRSTQDNPAGSPVWSDWQLFDRTEITGRGFQFRADITAKSTDYGVAIGTLQVVAEERA